MRTKEAIENELVRHRAHQSHSWNQKQAECEIVQGALLWASVNYDQVAIQGRITALEAQYKGTTTPYSEKWKIPILVRWFKWCLQKPRSKTLNG